MLELQVNRPDLWDEIHNVFVQREPFTLILEHSLLSISKWESKWEKSYLSSTDKTFEEDMDYIRCMTVNNVNPEAYKYLTNEHIERINSYINAPMTATNFFSIDDEEDNNKPRKKITSEQIYSWMITLHIPVEFQKWHINRLMTLIKVCNIENSPPKKPNHAKSMDFRKQLNEQRKKKYNTKG